MTKTEKQLFEEMMAAMERKNARELDFIIANREYEAARKAYLEYALEPSLGTLNLPLGTDHNNPLSYYTKKDFALQNPHLNSSECKFVSAKLFR